LLRHCKFGFEDSSKRWSPGFQSKLERGSRWNREIAGKLEQSKVGIVCLTADNLMSARTLSE